MKSPSIIRRFIAEPLREQIWFAVKGIHPSQSSDRRLLETTIIPWLGSTGTREVLFIGVRSYTRHYPRLFSDHGQRMWSFDIDPATRRSGPAGRHAVADVTSASPALFSRTMDAIVFSGVLGYGVDTPAGARKALANLAGWMPDSGVLVVGWNIDRIADPMQQGDCPLRGAGYRWVGRRGFQDSTHVYDLLVKGHDINAPDWLDEEPASGVLDRLRTAGRAAMIALAGWFSFGQGILAELPAI